MGRRGPKPKTAEQLRVIGSHAPRAKSRGRPSGVPACPSGLSLAAKRHWQRLAPKLKAEGLVGQLDESALARYCVLSARLDDCQKKIDDDGAVVLYTNGNFGKSPWVTIAAETAKLLLQLEKELGLTPYARQSLKPHHAPQTEEPAAKYFG